MRGAYFKVLFNITQYTMQIRKHIFIFVSQYREAKIPKTQCTYRVFGLQYYMCATIQLYNQFLCDACEIDNVALDDMLTSEFMTVQLSVSEKRP